MTGNLKSLVSRVTPTCRSALNAAAGMCLSRTNYEVEIEHLLVQLIEREDSDVSRVLRGLGIDSSRVLHRLTPSLDRMKTGNGRAPAIATRLVSLLTSAWVIGSLDFNATQIRSGFILLALFADPELSRFALDIVPNFDDTSSYNLRSRFRELTAGSPEEEKPRVERNVDDMSDITEPERSDRRYITPVML